MRLARLPRPTREPDDRGMDERAETPVEERGYPHDDAGADHVENALENIRPDQKRRERDQRRDTAAREHPVVDLQHIEGAGEHQNVHRARKHRHAPEGAAAVLQRCCDDVLRGRVIGFRTHHSGCHGLLRGRGN